MKKLFWVTAVLAVVLCGMVACQLMTNVSPKEASAIVFDRHALVDRVRATFAELSASLEAETGDQFDFDNLRFFSATNLNGADETVVIIPLTADSPSYLVALQSEEEAPINSIVPLPHAGFLSLNPSNCFHSLENGVPYLIRMLGHESADVVNASGVWIRDATDVSWNRGAEEPEWYKYLGNTSFHFPTCAVITMNQGK